MADNSSNGKEKPAKTEADIAWEKQYGDISRLGALDEPRQTLYGGETVDPKTLAAEAEEDRERLQPPVQKMTSDGHPLYELAQPTLDAYSAEERPRPADEPPLTVYHLTPKDLQEPPFHFANVVRRFIVAARSMLHARHIAAADAGIHSAVWLDEAKTDCVVLEPAEAGLVARDMTGV